MRLAGACTGIALATTGGDHVIGRTIEWGEFDLESKLVVSPRGQEFVSHLPMDKHGVGWTSAYGFVGISVSADTFIGEGLNEVGLNAGLFYFKGFGSLARFDPENVGGSLVDMDFVRWMLTQFQTVAEVKEALPSITLAPVYIDADGVPTPTAHWRVTDRAGGSIVIEVVDHGEVHVYDNHVGVLTNSPPFPWQVENLNTYINVRPGTVADRDAGDIPLTSFGTGTAAWGLPGDFSPTSRFVRAAYLRATTPPLDTSTDAVSQAFHILNNFDIPVGTEFAEADRDKIPALPSATQWTAVSDLTGKRYFYKTMRDSSIRCVDLTAIDFGSGAEQTYPLDETDFVFRDVTPTRR